MSIKSLVKLFFERTELVLVCAIILPLLFVINVTFIQSWIELILGIVMFLSIRPFFKKKFDKTFVSKDFKAIFLSLFFNYILLSGIYLIVAFLFFPIFSDYFIGYLLLALVPPAVSIVPLCYLTKCDIKIADTALIIGYILALIIIPLAMMLIFGTSFNFMLLFRSLIIIIFIPLILAYFTRNNDNILFNYTKIFTNILLGLIIVIVVSLNRPTFLDIGDIGVMQIFIINVLVIFIFGLLVYYISKKFVSSADAVDYSLYATQKNEATGIAIALLLFNSNVAVPLIIALIIQFVYFIFFERVILKE